VVDAGALPPGQFPEFVFPEGDAPPMALGMSAGLPEPAVFPGDPAQLPVVPAGGAFEVDGAPFFPDNARPHPEAPRQGIFGTVLCLEC